MGRRLVGAALIVASTTVVVSPVGAIDGAGISPDPIVVDRQVAVASGGIQDQAATVRASFSVNITGTTPNTNQFIDICFKNPADADFSYVRHCGGTYGSSVISDADGNASRTSTFIYGADYASEEWGFFDPRDPNLPAAFQAYGEIPTYSSGWIRIADGDRLTSDPTKFTAVPFRIELGTPAPGSTASGAAGATGSTGSVGTTSPTGDPAPGESVMVSGANGRDGISITG